MTKDVVEKKAVLSKPKDVKISQVSVEFLQEEDSCDSVDCGQEIKVYTQDAGAGNYLCIETKRWAIDDVDGFYVMLKDVLRIAE